MKTKCAIYIIILLFLLTSCTPVYVPIGEDRSYEHVDPDTGLPTIKTEVSVIHSRYHMVVVRKTTLYDKIGKPRDKIETRNWYRKVYPDPSPLIPDFNDPYLRRSM
jgi:hypothetical protein